MGLVTADSGLYQKDIKKLPVSLSIEDESPWFEGAVQSLMEKTHTVLHFFMDFLLFFFLFLHFPLMYSKHAAKG